MDNQQKRREDINDSFKWDLTTIYKTDKKWYSDYNRVSKEILEIDKYRGILISNGDNLYNFLTLNDKLERKIYKLYYYAHLKQDEDTVNTNYQTMFGKIKDLMLIYNEKIAFEKPELLKSNYNQIEKFYKQVPALKEYKFTLENIFRYKNHIVSEKEDLIINNLSKAINNASETYTSFIYSDLEFGQIKDENDNLIELTESNYSKIIKSKNRDVRASAFTRLFTTYGSYKNTISSTFKGNIDALIGLSKIHNFNSSLEASLFNENINVEVYNNLIETVSNNLDKLFKYYDLKKEILNLKELHLYDIYVDIVSGFDKEYTFDKAKDLVTKSLSVLGKDYIKNLNKAFKEKWIDIYNNKGKRTGAYSSGFYDTNPFILLNFEGKLNNVSTLAHELGHSMHTYYSCKNNSYQYSSYDIFVAEVASTVNELLLNKYLLKNSTSNDEKLYILNNMMELFKSTIYRQVMFAEFEKDMHQKASDGEVLTYELLCDSYYKLNKKYFGSNVVVDDLIKYEWERIPHFYYNFYVYKYAIGLSCACYIVDNILSNKDKSLENYIKFLSSGGSDYPINELKLADIDITSKEVIESALNMFDDTIEQFKEIYNRK